MAGSESFAMRNIAVLALLQIFFSFIAAFPVSRKGERLWKKAFTKSGHVTDAKDTLDLLNAALSSPTGWLLCPLLRS